MDVNFHYILEYDDQQHVCFISICQTSYCSFSFSWPNGLITKRFNKCYQTTKCKIFKCGKFTNISILPFYIFKVQYLMHDTLNDIDN